MLQRLFVIGLILLLCACSAREIQGSLSGSTAQRLVTHSVDDLMRLLPEEPFAAYRNKNILLHSHFLHDTTVKTYADERLKHELKRRFNIQVTREPGLAQGSMTVFYTSLATDKDTFGLTIPLGYVPGFDESTKLNILSLEKFHGIAEMYYFIGNLGEEERQVTLQSVVKTDALGLPFITIPINTLERAGEKPDRKRDAQRRKRFHEVDD